MAALSQQSLPDFEIIIADDGSPESYAPLLTRWAPKFRHPIQHVRHEDLGFRKTRIMNRAVHVSHFDTLIFLDMDCLPHRDFDMAMYAWISAPDSVPRSIFDSTEIPDAANGYSGQNDTGFKNPEMDRLIEATETELDPAKRKALWAAMQRLYAIQLPSLPLYFRSNVFILPKWLSGLRPTGNQYPTTLWITDWTAQ